MRKSHFLFLIFIFSLFNLSSYAQVPESFNYQAVIRDNTGELIINKSIGVRASINDITADGSTLYRETHTVTTTNKGLVNIQVGAGTSDIGNFSDIDWGANKKYLEIEINLGTAYVSIGTSQMLSVPYALYADKASTAELLGTEGVYSTTSDTLFVVKDHNGNVVFAVFPDGAEVTLPTSSIMPVNTPHPPIYPLIIKSSPNLSTLTRPNLTESTTLSIPLPPTAVFASLPPMIIGAIKATTLSISP